MIFFNGGEEGRKDYGDDGGGGGCGEFCSFYSSFSPGIQPKHTITSIGLR
jgi:hypothetical protein